MKQGEEAPIGPGSEASEPEPIALVESVRRIVLLGAESTGTTTLARDLAERMSVPWAPEFLREYAEERANEAGTIWDVVWTPADFDRVAQGQDELEHAAISDWISDPDRYRAGAHGPLVICDTDALATAMWARRYLGTPAPRFLRQAAARPPALYLLTSPEGVEFFQDGLRDGEHIRGEMHDWFRIALRDQQVPWIELTGDQSTRIELALKAIDELVDGSAGVNPIAPNEQR
jgi:HTH-type transcriptional repressor of NAD biosynthesis genes